MGITKGKVAVAASLGVLLLAGFLMWLSAQTPGLRGKAMDSCEQSVLKKLKAPSSAEFGDMAIQQVHKETAELGGYTITGWVEAENALGVRLRTDWSCFISVEPQHPAGDWGKVTFLDG